MQVIHLADRGPQSEHPPPRSCDIVNTILTLPVQYSRAQTRHLLVGSWVLLLPFVVVLIPMLSDPNRVRSLNLYIEKREIRNQLFLERKTCYANLTRMDAMDCSCRFIARSKDDKDWQLEAHCNIISSCENSVLRTARE